MKTQLNLLKRKKLLKISIINFFSRPNIEDLHSGLTNDAALLSMNSNKRLKLTEFK